MEKLIKLSQYYDLYFEIQYHSSENVFYAEIKSFGDGYEDYFKKISNLDNLVEYMVNSINNYYKQEK